MTRTKALLLLRSNNSFLFLLKKKKSSSYRFKNKWAPTSFFSVAQRCDAPPHQFGQWKGNKKGVTQLVLVHSALFVKVGQVELTPVSNVIKVKEHVLLGGGQRSGFPGRC